jgi:hypothetical protein
MSPNSSRAIAGILSAIGILMLPRAGIAIEPFWGLFIAWHPLVSLDQYGRYHFM